MSFLDSSRNVGRVLIVAGLLFLVGAAETLVRTFVSEGSTDPQLYGGCLEALGSLIVGYMYIRLGSIVASRAAGRKTDVLAKYVRVVGLSLIVQAVFGFVLASDRADRTSDAVIWAVTVIVAGLLIVYAGTKIDDRRITMADRVIWVLLLLALVASIAMRVMDLFDPDPVGVLTDLVSIIVFLFMIAMLFDIDVRYDMGMCRMPRCR